MSQQNEHRYDDIINLPHHVSVTRKPMSRWNRAAQFSPFAALTGYEDAVLEAGRLTDAPAELDESRRAELSEALRRLREREGERPSARITYFRHDLYKPGGAYVTAEGPVKKVDPVYHTVTMADGTVIDMEDVAAVEPL
ncbi:MAG: hypothetical protein II458_09285 [Oscillospiraceae bacterium]|nr:hypothetical protein [Oscillospiraceae bacterium]